MELHTGDARHLIGQVVGDGGVERDKSDQHADEKGGQTAMEQLGGHAMFLDGKSLHAGTGQETIHETAAIISSMADAVMIRSLSQQVIDEFVAASTVPVISGMSCAEFRSDGFGSQEQHHPTQVIADLITMIERKPKGKQLSDLTFMWLGDGADGFDCVFMDHLSLFPRLGIRVICAAPKKYGKSAAQTALRWNVDRQVGVVTRSRNPEHIREDFDIWDFHLSEADRKAIDEMDIGYSEILDYRNPNIARMFIQKSICR